MRFCKKNPSHWKNPRNRRYFGAMFEATPPWLTDEHKKEFHAVYRRARLLRKSGNDVHVDHIVPILSDLVCGLHVPWNLQIIGAGPNMSKGNNWWPDCPWDNHDAFGAYEPQQLRLPI